MRLRASLALVAYLLATAVLATLSPVAAADPGQLDSSFGSGGIARFFANTSNTTFSSSPTAYDAVVQPDQKIVVAGSAVADDLKSTYWFLIRLTSDGALDPAFGQGGIVTRSFGSSTFPRAHALIREPDGHLIVGGTSSSITGDFVVARYGPDGTPDSNFGSSGVGVISSGFGWDGIRDLCRQPDGKIVAVGSAYYGNTGKLAFALARFNANGTPDQGFGVVLTPFGSQPDTVDSSYAEGVDCSGGAIVAGGGTTRGFALARYFPSGALDPSFDGDGKVITTIPAGEEFPVASAENVILGPGSSITVAGSTSPPSQTSTGDYGLVVARYTAGGQLDTGFSSDGVVTVSYPSRWAYSASAALQSDGKTVFSGWFSDTDETIGVGRINADGSFDSTFSNQGATTAIGVSDTDVMPYGMALEDDGDLIAVGRIAENAPADNDAAFVARVDSAGAAYFSDTDGDGVPDVRDSCPTQPAQTSDGCPIPPPPPDVDTDEDGIPDRVEGGPSDLNGDGTADVDLQELGADPRHKDVFVEIDALEGHRLGQAAINRVVAAFGAAPVSNPDHEDGITLHVDNGSTSVMNPTTGATWGSKSKSDTLPSQPVLGAYAANGDYDWSAFDQTKHISGDRERVFHYAISADRYGSSQESSGGIARGMPSSDFIVSLGFWWQGGTEDQQAGTFMHELGHTLGLDHGGAGDPLNDKPNYLSVMNYAFQNSGVPVTQHNYALDYSRFDSNDLADLAESGLNEVSGFAPNDPAVGGYWTLRHCWAGVAKQPITGHVDWNCNKLIEGITSVDANADGRLGTLKSHDDWNSLVYDGGAIGNFGSDPPIPPDKTVNIEPSKETLDEREQVVSDDKKPVISELSVVPRPVAVGSKVRFRYRLSETASVTLRVKRWSNGRYRFVRKIARNQDGGQRQISYRPSRTGSYRGVLSAVDRGMNASTPRTRDFRAVSAGG